MNGIANAFIICVPLIIFIIFICRNNAKLLIKKCYNKVLDKLQTLIT